MTRPEPAPERTPPDDTGRHPLEALVEAECTHERHRWLCLNCAADAMRPEIERLLTLIHEPTTAEDRYWQAEAQRARAERDALALRLLQMADAWEERFNQTGIRADVAAEAVRSAVETMGWR